VHFSLTFLSDYHPKKEFGRRLKHLRQRKKQPWVSMDLSTNAYWELIPP
jgi:hypothetical protein